MWDEGDEVTSQARIIMQFMVSPLKPSGHHFGSQGLSEAMQTGLFTVLAYYD